MFSRGLAGGQVPQAVKNDSEKERMCITESLCCTAEINIVNQLDFNKKNEKKKKYNSGFYSEGGGSLGGFRAQE